MYYIFRQEWENYVVNHPHIAADVHDGLCAQLLASDIFAYGRIMHMVAVFITENSVETLSKKCMVYHSNLRPSIYSLASQTLTREERVWGHCCSRIVQHTPLRLGAVSGC